jgi:hypothetical protein
MTCCDTPVWWWQALHSIPFAFVFIVSSRDPDKIDIEHVVTLNLLTFLEVLFISLGSLLNIFMQA